MKNNFKIFQLKVHIMNEKFALIFYKFSKTIPVTKKLQS